MPGEGRTRALRGEAGKVCNPARKLRARLGGGPSVLDPLPAKPSRMHWVTYRRRLAAVIAAQECSLALQLDWLRTRYPDVTLAPRAGVFGGERRCVPTACGNGLGASTQDGRHVCPQRDF